MIKCFYNYFEGIYDSKLLNSLTADPFFIHSANILFMFRDVNGFLRALFFGDVLSRDGLIDAPSGLTADSAFISQTKFKNFFYVCCWSMREPGYTSHKLIIKDICMKMWRSRSGFCRYRPANSSQTCVRETL